MSDKYKIHNSLEVYFLTLTIYNWIDLFTRKNHKLCIVDSLQYCCLNKGLHIYAWCLMSNHLHLLAKADNLSGIIRDFKKYTSKKLIEQIINEPESRRERLLKSFKEAGRDIERIKNYKIWQDGSHAIEITSKEFFLEKMNYIHNNPVIELIVSNVEDYLFSSAKNYAGEMSLIDVEKVY